MPPKIPDLWPDNISTEILTPIAIMRAQIAGLERRTQGLIEVDINSSENDNRITHNFDLIVPSLDGFRERILGVSHDLARVYPTILRADVFKKEAVISGVTTITHSAMASTQEEFIEKLSLVLRSDHVRSTIESLIAQINDIKTQTAENQAEIDSELR